MEGKTLFLKFNTGPPAMAPLLRRPALALKRAGADGVKVSPSRARVA